MFFDFTSLSVDGLEMKSLTTSDGVVLFRKSGDLDYIPLQWIQSTGGQWCYAANTGDQVQFRCPGIDVKYNFMENVGRNSKSIAGAAYNAGQQMQNDRYFHIDVFNDDGFYGGYSVGVPRYSCEIDQRQISYGDVEARLVVEADPSVSRPDLDRPNSLKYYEDGVLKQTDVIGHRNLGSETDYFNGNKVTLFAEETNGQIKYHSRIRLHYFKAYNYDSSGNPYLVCEMLPAKDTQTGRVGLWDNLGKRMVYSESGTDFIAGPEA